MCKKGKANRLSWSVDGGNFNKSKKQGKYNSRFQSLKDFLWSTYVPIEYEW